MNGGDDLGGVCGPEEGLRVMVGLLEIAVDGGLEVDDRSEPAALQASLGQGGEEGLDRVEPRARGRREVEGDARVAGEPGDHLGLLMGGVVVEDDVDELAGRDRRLDGVEEADNLLMPVALHAASEHGAVQDIEGGEQCGGAVALVVVGHRPGAALLERQAGLGAVERLDLMGWMAPSRHQRAKLVAVESHQDRSHPPCRLQRLASIWPSMSSRFTVSTQTRPLLRSAASAAGRSWATSRSLRPAGLAWRPAPLPTSGHGSCAGWGTKCV